MKLTDIQLIEVYSQIEQKKTIISWLRDNKIALKPAEVIDQLNEKYGTEVISSLVTAMRLSQRSKNVMVPIQRRINRLIQNDKLSSEDCDNLVASLQELSNSVIAKKENIQFNLNKVK